MDSQQQARVPLEQNLQALQQRLAMMSRLSEASRLVNSSLDQEVVLRQIFDQLQVVVPHDTTSVMLRDGPAMRMAGTRGFADPTPLYQMTWPAEGGTLAAVVLQTQQPLIVDDVRQHPAWAVADYAERVRGWLGVPLLINGQAVGVLCLDSWHPCAFTPTDAQITLAFARHAAVALENARLYHELNQLKEFNETIVQTMGDGVMLEDEHGIIRFANPRALQLMGYTAEQLLDHHYTDFVAERDHPMVTGESGQRSRGVGSSYQLTLNAGSGREITVLVTATPQFDQGRFTGVLNVFTDITDRVAVEVDQRNMLAVASHDLRSPLQLIRGYLELILEEDDLPVADQRRYLRVAHEHAVRLHYLANQLLDLSRMDAGEYDLHLEFLDPAPLLARIVQEHQAPAAVKDLTLQYGAPGELPAVRVDAGAIERVLDNLLNNAIKFTPPGGSIVVEAVPQGQELRISVRDTGPGIAHEHLSRVFQRFYRAPHLPAQTGAGLGLAIVKRLVEAHGGRVSAASSGVPGEGAAFTVALPITLGPNPAH
jgi:NtrC-family two-component system sensor histidine kinase KinB